MILDKEYVGKIVKTTSDLMVKKGKEELFLITTNDSSVYMVRCPLSEGAFDFVVDQSSFIGIANNLEELNIEQKGYKIRIFDGKSEFILSTKPEIGLPEFKIPEKLCPVVSLPLEHLSSTVADNDQFSSNNVRETVYMGNDMLASTDGLSLTVTDSGLEGIASLVPRALFNRIKADSLIGFDDTFVYIVNDDLYCFGASLYGQFPDVRSVVDKVEYVNHFSGNKEDLINLFGLCSPILSDDLKVGKMTIEGDTLTLKVKDDLSSFESSIPINSTADFECRLNVETFKKVIKPFTEKELKIHFADGHTPIKIRGDHLTKLMVLSNEPD